MTPQKKEDWTPEPFPEPRTIPEGWHAAAFLEKAVKSDGSDSASEWQPDPFPEPRMFPWGSSR
jgi:hypothetical protein